MKLDFVLKKFNNYIEIKTINFNKVKKLLIFLDYVFHEYISVFQIPKYDSC